MSKYPFHLSKAKIPVLAFFHQILWHMFHVATYKLKILLFSAEEVPALIKLGLINTIYFSSPPKKCLPSTKTLVGT
jgi:hypothetical protein